MTFLPYCHCLVHFLGTLIVPGATALLNPGKIAGARIHSASWGGDATTYTIFEHDIDRYIHDDENFLLVVAAGNEGPDSGTVRSPANAKNTLSGMFG